VKDFNNEVFFGSGFTFRTPQISVLRLSYRIHNNTGNELITLHWGAFPWLLLHWQSSKY